MANKLGLIFVSVLAAQFLPGCSSDTGNAEESTVVCSPDWYKFIESSVSTGDGLGHGPDPGSKEWRSTVEFRLGIRGLPAVPDRMTNEWCRYIDTKISAQ